MNKQVIPTDMDNVYLLTEGQYIRHVAVIWSGAADDVIARRVGYARTLMVTMGDSVTLLEGPAAIRSMATEFAAGLADEAFARALKPRRRQKPEPEPTVRVRYGGDWQHGEHEQFAKEIKAEFGYEFGRDLGGEGWSAGNGFSDFDCSPEVADAIIGAGRWPVRLEK
jgi:hypothetical protein